MRTRCAKISDDIVAIYILQDIVTKAPIVDLHDVESMPITVGVSDLVYNRLSSINIYVMASESWCVIGTIWIGSLHRKDEFNIEDISNRLYNEYFRAINDYRKISVNDIRKYLADINGAMFKVDRKDKN